MKKPVLSLLAALALTACGQDPIVVAPRSFERPGRMAFACLDISQTPAAARPLEDCRADADGNLDDGLALHVFVVQSTRGEVGAVDVTNRVLLDSDPTIPGYNFLPTGEFPVDIAIPKTPLEGDEQIYAYVANYGSRDIYAMPVTRFRSRLDIADTEFERIALPAAPSAMALSPNGKHLIVTLPSEGALLEVPLLAGGTFGTPRTIALLGDVGEAPAPILEGSTFERICTTERIASFDEAATRPQPAAGTPSPLDVVLDTAGETPELLVTDGVLPIVHRFAFDENDSLVEESSPITVDSPLTTLALTPPVPRSAIDPSLVRYAYAIDRDARVLAIRWDGEAAGSSVVVAPATENGADRVSFDALATSLSVISVDYDAASPTGNLCAPGDGRTVGPANLRGVFVGVTLTDGTLRILDVYDLDAACRGAEGECADAPGVNSSDSVTYIRRHMPRVGGIVQKRLGLSSAPLFFATASQWSVDVQGATNPEAVPDLVSLGDDCGSSRLLQAFPPIGEGEPRICVLADAWNLRGQRWAARYQGNYASGFSGTLSEDGEVTTTPGLCARGLMSRATTEAASEAAPERRLAGDLLVVTSNPLPSMKDDAECVPYRSEDPITNTTRSVAFRVDGAFDDRIVIGEMVGRGDLTDTQRSIAGVLRCYGSRIVFALAPENAYAVIGESIGFVHRVHANDSNECVVDETLDVRRQGRAVQGARFENFQFAFELSTTSTTPSDTRLEFATGNLPSVLGVDVGMLPVSASYSPYDSRLYVVDSAQRGLVQVGLKTFLLERAYE